MGHAAQIMATSEQALSNAQTLEAPTIRSRAATPAHTSNQAHLRRLTAGGQPLQTKLTIGAVNDPLEHEADAAADRVMRTADPQLSLSAAPVLSRKCAACEEEHELQRDATGDMDGAVAPPIVDTVLSSPGRALDSATQDFMAQRFGTDFSDVRIHTDAQAAQSAAAVKARAFTVGRDVVFGAGQYDPAGANGRHLLAHELAHVVQQTDGGGASVSQVFRAPAQGADSTIHPAAMAFLESKMTQFFELLSPAERIRLKRNSTVAIGMVTVDGDTRLVYTVANNGTSKQIRKAADALDLHRWTYDSGVKGRGPVGAPNDAEQLMEGFSTDNDADLHGLVVSRRVCLDCGEVIPAHNHGRVQVKVIEDPIPMPARRPKPTPGAVPSRPKTPVSAPEKSSSGAPTGSSQPKPPAEMLSVSMSKPPAETPATSLPKVEPVAGLKTAPRSTPKSTEAPKTTAMLGEPIKPVNEETPGYDPHGSGIGGAIQMIQAAQFAGLQQAEFEKLNARLAKLQPKIDALLGGGSSVELILIMEKPVSTDFFCVAHTYCDQSQIIYFRELFISRIWEPLRAPKAPTITNYPTIGPTDGRDSHVPYTVEGGSITDESEIRFMKPEHPDHHCVYEKERWDPKPGLAAPQPAEPDMTTPDQVKKIVGTYKAEFRQMFQGSYFDFSQMGVLASNRSLKIEMTPEGRAKPTLTLNGRPYSFFDGGSRPPRTVASGRFAMDKGISSATTSFRSVLTSYPENGMILEWTRGLDSELKDTWDALFKWQRV